MKLTCLESVTLLKYFKQITAKKMVDSWWLGMYTKILGEKDGQHTNHPGWLVTVRFTTGLEVARSFGRLSTWGFGLRLHRLNPCRYTKLHGGWGIHFFNSYGICKTSGISNHFCWYFQIILRVQEHVGAGNEFPLNFQSSNVLHI